jgi:hypothetical protein
MKKTKLIYLLDSLSDEEMKQFYSFASCYMFNPRSVKVSELLAVLSEYYPGFEDEGFTKEVVWSRLYPDKKYNDVVMRNLISDLYSLLRRFLAHLKLEQDEAEISKHLLEELYFRGKPDLAEKEADRLEALSYKHFRTNGNAYLNLYAAQCLRHVVNLKDWKFQDKSWQDEKMMFLIHFFIKEMIGYYQNYVSLKTFVKSEYDMMLFDELMTFGDMNYEKLDTQLKLLFNSTVILVYPHREDVFEKTLKLLKEKGGEIEKLTHYNLLISMANYCLTKRRDGNLSYNSKLREIHLEQVKYNLLAPEERMEIHEPIFTNVVRMALDSGEYDWAQNFVRKNFHRMEEKGKIMLHYYQALLHHYKGENEKALEEMSMVKALEFTDKVILNNLQMRIFFDLGYYDSVLTTAENYRKFFKGNKKLSEDRKKGNENFIDYTLKILRATEKNDKDALGVIRRKLEKMTDITEREWLLSKAGD